MICIANNQCAIHALGLTDAALNPSSSRFLAGGKILQDYIRALALSLAEGGQLLSGPEVQFTRTFTEGESAIYTAIPALPRRLLHVAYSPQSFLYGRP
jgi:hypothetical protein